MSRHWSLIFPLLLILPIGCSELRVGRTYLSEMEHDDSQFFNPREDFPVMAGDSGKEWMSERERRARTPASEEVMAEERKARALKAELKELEGLQSEENRKFYDQYKERMGSTSERIYFLKLPYYDRKEYLLTRGIISEPKSPYYTQEERRLAARNQDIVLGMTKEDVLTSWGKPTRVEVAGNPRYENERWLYRTNGASKYIYFESGQVEGWE